MRRVGTVYSPWQAAGMVLRARRYARRREYWRLCDPAWLAAIKP
jgi:hypothetical protein